MPRYAVIDHLTNFVWGVTDAKDAIDACRNIDTEFEEFGYEYGIIPAARRRSSPARSAYSVFKVPDGFVVRDGSDPAEIRAVKASAGTFEAIVERRTNP